MCASKKLVPSYAFLFFLLLATRAFGQIQAGSSAVGPNSFTNVLSAAQGGDVQAQVRVGEAYAEGTASPRDYREAMKWLQTASSQGSLEANAWMGNLYLLGRGVPRDVNRAAALIQPAAAANNPVGLRFLGLMYETGQGVPRDYLQAAEIYSKAVAQQDANSCDRLGILYLHGLGVRRDPAQAFALFTQGANLGDRWSQLHLGQMYQSGHIPSPSTVGAPAKLSKASSRMVLKTAPDYANAMKLYAASSAQRNSVATYKLGVLYENGWGVAQDYPKALEYYTQAAGQRFTPALVAFGRMYEFGLGGEVNLFNAYIGYSLAAEAGDPSASQRLHTLLGKLSPSDLQNAQALLKAAQQVAPPGNRNIN